MYFALTKTFISTISAIIMCGPTGTCDTNNNSQPSLSNNTHLEASLTNTATLIQQMNDPLSRTQNSQVKETVQLNVPFSSQAPYQKWIPPYDEACEETSLIMVEYYLKSGNLTKDTAVSEIIRMTDWQRERGYGVDTSAAEVAVHARAFYGRQAHLYYDSEVTSANIKKLLSSGHPVIIPAAGRILNNPNFQNGGPPYHMIVIVGYDDKNNFITHDPGTQYGQNYKYSEETIMKAIHDWTGSKSTVLEGRKAMLIVE
jgi:uncharacterized protein YvpB